MRNGFLSARLSGFVFGPVFTESMPVCPGFRSSCGQHPGQSGEIVGHHGQDEAGAHPLDAAIDGLCHAPDGLGPAESLFDPFAVFDLQDVTFVPGRAAVDR